jgi:hypothetical protein
MSGPRPEQPSPDRRPPDGEYLDRLRRELTAVGIRGARRARILDELADHLACDPIAELGDPGVLATQFADELGTSLARAAAFRAFAALAVTGAILVARLLTMGALNRIDGSVPDTFGLLAGVIAGQVAFAAGSLALLRAWRLRRQPSIPGAEATILARRAGIGLVAGAVATIAVPLRAAVSPHATSGPSWLSAVAVAVALVPLLLAGPSLVLSARLRPTGEGPAGDLLDDLPPLRTAVRTPTNFALAFAAALVVATTLAGIAGNDPYDGLARGLLEGGACLAGFGILGRYLGLRSASGPQVADLREGG